MQKPNKLLELEVKDELGWDPMFEAPRIVVNVDGGKVPLTGIVPTYDETVRADQDASRVGGIAAVDNQLMVGTIGSVVTDEDVAADCVVSLDIDRVVPRGALQVAARNGWVTLSGEVRHHFQRAAATRAIRRVRGVVGLTDCITFTHGPIPSDVFTGLNRHSNAMRSSITPKSRSPLPITPSIWTEPFRTGSP